jgi:hypothetical protein
MVANQCSAAQALSLKQMKETGCHDQLGLSSLAQISTENYREIAGNVVDNCLEIDGRRVPIVPKNASLIRAFVRACRSQRRAGPTAESPQIPGLELRLHALQESSNTCARARP